MNLVNHAKVELQALGMFDKDSDYEGKIGNAVMELIEVFSKQGHSGFSAGLVLDLFNKVSKYEPLCPLTGDDSEWCDVAESSGYTLYQNIRCSHVFKEDDNHAYDIDGIIFREPDDVTFTCGSSKKTVIFPYTPKSIICDVGFDTNPNTDIPHDLTPIDGIERERQRIMGRPV